MAITPVQDSGIPTAGLKRNALGVSALVFIVVSAAAPLTVMVGVAPLAVLVGGIGAPMAYVFAGLVLTLFAVGFTTMSRHVANAGAFYSYIALGLGKTAGVVAALLALVSYNALQIGIYGLLGISARATFLEVFGVDLPWWLYALAGMAVVWFVGWRSIDFGAKVLAVLLTAETAILLVLAIAILTQGGSAEGLGVDSVLPDNVLTSGMTSIVPVAFAAFMGFEATVLYRSEAREPRRTIPRATYIAVAMLALTYAFIVWTIIQAYGATGVVAAAAADPVGLFFAASDTYLGGGATTVMRLLFVTSIIASLVAFHNAITRYALAITREGLLPAWLGAIHPRSRSPYAAGLAQTAIALAVVAGFAIADADPYFQLLIWVNTPGVFGILLLQVAAALSVVSFFRRTPNPEGPWRTTVAPLLAAFAMAVATALAIKNVQLFTNASTTVNVALLMTLPATCAIGVAWAAWLRRNRPEAYAAIAIDLEDSR